MPKGVLPFYFLSLLYFYIRTPILQMKEVNNLVALGVKLQNSEQLNRFIETASLKNPWFTKQFTQQAIDALLLQMLNKPKLDAWLSAYSVKPVNKTVALIFAGNIPLVGFHDFLCCYVCGCKMKIKLSSKDDELFLYLLQLLFEIDPEAKNKIEIVDSLKNYDAVIATGSDNTNRYFEYYFRQHPKILRKSRNAIAVLNGEETHNDLVKLADDVFSYFGFGCRNVSKIYVPADFDLKRLFPAFEQNYKWLYGHTKYMNNYDYQRTILLLNKTAHLANEFLMLLENPSISSPIATLHYERWHNESVLESQLKQQQEKIQCIVSSNTAKWTFTSSVSFGEAQQPLLSDYADGVDTIAFLQSL